MATTIPAVVLPAPPTSAMPLRYGLLQAAVGPLELPVNARSGGLKYVTPLCADGFGYEIACIDVQADKSADFDQGLNVVTGTPFMIYATLQCGAAGYSFEENRSFVVERLKGVEQGVLEEIFSTSTFGQGPGLLGADGITTVVGGGTTALDVVSELERAMYCGASLKYGAPAYLHMPIPVFNELKAVTGLLSFDGTRWRTPMGSVVSSGCYAGNTPAGAAPADGTFWVYITGQTTVWRASDNDIHVYDREGSLDRTTNQWLLIAEREYVVTYECGGFAKAVTLWP